MAAEKVKNFEEEEKELEQYGSWVKGRSEDFQFDDIDEMNIDYSGGDLNNSLMTDEEEMLLGELESSESESESTISDISFDDFDDLGDEMDDTFGMETPDGNGYDSGTQRSDLSVKILRSIESELVGLRSEVKGLKTELNLLQKTAPLSAEMTQIEKLEDDQPATGFFKEEDDDETIALTGDELDNILVSADVEEKSISESDVDKLLISEEFDELPEEFEKTEFLDEDEFQDTADLVKDTELDSTLIDGLTLGEDDPALAELTESDVELEDEIIISDELTEDFDLDSIPDLSMDDTESFDIEGESFEIEEFDGLDGETFSVEEYTSDDIDISNDEVPPPIPISPVEESISNENEAEFDEGEEIDITIDEDIIVAPAETESSSVPFENLEEIDLSSFDENLVEETEEITIDIEPEDSLLPDLDEIIEEDLDIEEITFDDELDLPELEDNTLDEDITLDEFSLDELLSDGDELELPDLEDLSPMEIDDELSIDSVTIEDSDGADSPEEIALDDMDDEVSLDEITIDDMEDEVSLDEITIDDMDDELSLDEITIDDMDDEVSLDEITIDDIDDEVSLDEITIDDMDDEVSLDDIELPDLDEIILEEEDLIDLPDVDEIVIEEPEIQDSLEEIELPDLDDMVMEEVMEINDIEDEIELPDFDELIIDDDEPESLPDLDEILAESSPETELSSIELPDMDELILDDELELTPLDEESENDLFGNDSESVDLDSLEQLAVEEPEQSDKDFASEFSERVEEIRDAAKNGNIPEELKDEIKDILLYMDQLLESLPDDKIQEFARSEHFEVYKKIFEELGIKK